MSQLKNLEELQQLCEEIRRTERVRRETSTVITVGMGTCGIAAGARDVMGVFRALIAAKGTQDVILTNSGCAGLCSKEPMATVELRGGSPVKYINLSPERMARVFREHVQGGKVVADLALAAGCETTG